MLGFIVPVKEKSKSPDWGKDNELLKNTLHSICNQENPSFKVFVVYTDMPYFLKNDKVIYVKYPYPFVPAKEIADYETVLKTQFSDIIGERMFDQGKRILYGCKIAAESGCDFVMSVDADDYVSDKLSAFVAQNLYEEFGWFINKGYIWKMKYHLLLTVPNNMNHLNGSTHIVKAAILPKIDFDTRKLFDVTFFSAHGYLKERIFQQYHNTLKPLPFYGIIYLIHNSNWSNYKEMLKKEWVKTFLKYLFRGKLLTSSIKNDFGII